jgi:hypothetical protein
MTTPPIDPGQIDRGDVVMAWDPSANRMYVEIFMVISNAFFHSDGRDDVQLVQVQRPFRPFVVTRKRLKRIGHARRKLPQFEAGLRDLVHPGLNDSAIDARGYPRSVLEMLVEFTDGTGSKARPVVVVSRPLVWSVHDMVFFMDISSGLFSPCDCRLQYPDWIHAEPGSFVKGRLWWADTGEVKVYNARNQEPVRVHLEDVRAAVGALDRVLELGARPSWE